MKEPRTAAPQRDETESGSRPPDLSIPGGGGAPLPQDARPGGAHLENHRAASGSGQGHRSRPGSVPGSPGGSGRVRGVLEFFRQRWTALLSSQRFQRWSAAFPLTRPIALSRSRQVFDICAGFVYSQTLLALIRLDLFDRLARGPVRIPVLAREFGVPEDRLRRFLGAGVTIRLLRWAGSDGVGLGPLGAPMVGNEAVARMVEHNVLLYRDLEDPLALLRGETREGVGLKGYWPYVGRSDREGLDPDDVAPYSELMAGSQPMVAQEVLDGYDFDEHTHVLDVGGGKGAFLRAVGRRHSDLRLTLFDLPPVVEVARRHLDEFPDPSRLSLVGGDFLRDEIPKGADLITLVRILHDHEDEDVVTLLRRIRGVIPEDGTLLVAEPMAGIRGAETVGAAYFALYLMAMGQGRPRTPRELTALLKQAGFTRIRHPRPRSPVLTSLLIARP